MEIERKPEVFRILDGYPDLYEIPPKMLPHMEALGILPVKVLNKAIISNVLDGLDALYGKDT